MKLGEATNSYDADGDITETLQWDHLTLEQLQQEAQSKFIGDLQQIPPMFSALRVKGKRLYESAREGIVVERAARSVRVSQFDLTRDAEDSQKIHFYIACSKGTYIRSLAHDLVRSSGPVIYTLLVHMYIRQTFALCITCPHKAMSLQQHSCKKTVSAPVCCEMT